MICMWLVLVVQDSIYPAPAAKKLRVPPISDGKLSRQIFICYKASPSQVENYFSSKLDIDNLGSGHLDSVSIFFFQYYESGQWPYDIIILKLHFIVCNNVQSLKIAAILPNF